MNNELPWYVPRPIETAPKDGRRLLLYQPPGKFGGGWTDCRWDDSWQEFETDEGLSVRGATHWMPEPPAP